MRWRAILRAPHDRCQWSYGLSEQPTSPDVEHIAFDNNRLAAELSGPHDSHLAILEKQFDVRVHPRGNHFAVSGSPDGRAQTIAALKFLYGRLQRGDVIGIGAVRAAAKLSQGESASEDDAPPADTPSVKTPKRLILARTPNQADYLRKLSQNKLTFGVGPAGTGKTYLAVAHAVGLMQSGVVERMILSRPALEAGERIGFLPGDLKEKVDPFLRPLYDALHDMLNTDYVERRIGAGDIEIAPVAFMRGRTLARAAVILDEAQNATAEQMKMFLTRLGEGAHMTITGDPTQTDLPRGVTSGLSDALNVLTGVEGVAVTQFTAKDVVRHPLVAKIIAAYEKHHGA